MTLEKPTTARKGNPGECSRGRAVRAAKHELAALIDAQLGYTEMNIGEIGTNEKRLALLSAKAGETVTVERVKVATLDQLKAWTAAMGAEMERRVA